MGVAKITYARLERGDSTISLGIDAMAIYALGLGEPFGTLVDQGRDDQGLLFYADRDLVCYARGSARYITL